MTDGSDIRVNKAQRREPLTIAKDEPKKRKHLMTDDDFGHRLASNLIVMTSLTVACMYNQSLSDFTLDMYYDMKERMMQIASEMAWWSVLGLLSSSCCALQILLNALSFGCAGFNNFLGPARPTFVAFTIMAQLSSWYVAYSRPYQWRVTALSTFLSLCFTLLPEVLAWQTTKREERRIRREQLRTGQLDDLLFASSSSWSLSNDDIRCSANDGKRSIKLHFQLSTMGCASCVSTVSKVLDGIQGIIQHKVSLEDGLAIVVLDETVHSDKNEDKKQNSDQFTIRDTLWNDIAQQLELSGFPVSGGDDSTKKDR